MNFMVVALGAVAILMPLQLRFGKEKSTLTLCSVWLPASLVASLTAFLVGSFLNAYVMSKMK